jgi:PAS domain S-box-containing protein
MARLLSMPIRNQLFLVVLIVALAAFGLIIYSGLKLRDEAISNARRETYQLAEGIASEQQNLIAAAQQLILALAQLPDVKKQNAAKVEPILQDILKLNSQYSNIFIADKQGLVWATAVPVKPPFIVADRRYFKNALARGRLSSGEYVISRATSRPAFNVAHPLKDNRGETIGIISIGFVLDAFKHVLDRANLPPGSSFILLDHKGVVLYRAISPAEYIGKTYDPQLFRQMKEGPDTDTFIVPVTISGDKRILTYKKIRLPGEEEAFMYVRAGIPFDAILSKANETLIRNMAIFTSFILLAFWLAWVIGKRAIADRVTLLVSASQRLANGDLHVRVSDIVEGGELGNLGKTFDAMAQQLSLREQALSKSERNYREIFNSTKDTIFVHEADSGKILAVNKTFEEMYGYSMDEISNITLQDLSCGEPPYTMEETGQWLRKTFNEGPQSFEWLAKKKNGENFWVEVVLSTTSIGGEGRVLAVVRDIDERKQAEKERQKLEAQLRQAQKMEAIGQLAGGVAHDFNNMLQAITGYGSLLKQKMGGDNSLSIYVDQILSSAEKSANLTRQLLAFSRKQLIEMKPIDINDLVVNIGKLIQRLIGEDIELRTKTTDKALTVMGDRGQIEQVLMNLATNARDAMPKGGLLSIETAEYRVDETCFKDRMFEKPGLYALITVSDTGIGMDEKTKEQLFEPFYTTKEMERGTGLGLSIVYGIIKQHGGEIHLYSEVGKGTTFSIYLPLVQMEKKDEAEGELLSLKVGTETILLAEDQEEVRRALEMTLEGAGYRVIDAVDGEDAINKFKENKDSIQLIMVDVIMPKKSGKETIDEIKKIKPGVKVIFTSGYTSDIISREGILEKGMDFISKPITPYNLLAKIRKILDREARL